MRESRASRFVLMGWGGVILVAAAILLVSGPEERGAGVAFGLIGLALATWAWRWWGRAVIIASLILGLVWTLQFAAYAVAGGIDDPFEPAIFATDLVAVVAGVLIVVGAVRGLSERRGASEART